MEIQLQLKTTVSSFSEKYVTLYFKLFIYIRTKLIFFFFFKPLSYKL